MIIQGALPGKPVQLLRTSSEQMRRAADLLDQIAGETAVEAPVSEAALAAEGAGRRDEADQTIRLAQRSFAAALRLAQFQEAPDDV